MAKRSADRRKASVLSVVVAVYVGGFACWLFLRLLFFDRFWPLALLNTFGEYFFLPLPLLIAIALYQRQWRLLWPFLLPGIVFVVMFGELYLPTYSGFSRPDAPAFSAMSFNVLWSNKNYKAIAAAVQASSPDIVGFEELHPGSFDGIAAELEIVYPYHTLKPDNPHGGVGLFSRYPLKSVEPLALPPRDLALHAVVDFDGQPIHVFVVHLSANNFGLFPLDQLALLAKDRYVSRAAETARLQEIIEPISEPAIVLCDCNLTDTSQAYTRLALFLKDSFREAGWGSGHTLLHPFYSLGTQRLDYVWHNNALTAIEAFVGSEGGSDHLPITARLVVTVSP